MKRNIMNEAEKLIKAHRRKKRWYQAVTCLAGIVVFCTVYSLILPAITMEKYQCGIEEHTHTQECYDAENSLICGLEEHVHTDACVRSEEAAENGTQETSETTDDTSTSETEKTTENTEDTKTDKTVQDAETQEEWEATFQSVELTGKYPEDVLAIAKTQIGYTESTENYVTDEAGEDRGYTRYGQWYGEPYGEWSGMFASFCLHYAGVEGMPLSDDCEEWIKELSKEEYSLYHEASDTEYEPVPGDLVFFDLDGDTKADHTGIISEVNISETENELKTIEGDWEDKVQTVTRSVDDEKILGYGALPEQEKEEKQTEENAQAQDFELSVATESGITVTVSGSGDALPYPADEITVKAQEVTDKSVQELWNQVLEKEDTVSGENFLLDITLWHDEKEIEPTGNVTVVFSGFDTEGYSPKIYHIDEEAEEVTDMNAVLEESGDISLETDHFSVYAGTAVAVDSKALSGFIGNDLQNGGNFYLTDNAWTEQDKQLADLTITKDTVINLNGYTLTISKANQCFNIQNGATLTIVDSKDITDEEGESSGSQLYGNKASLENNTLTYYITESTPNDTGTTEVLKKHTVDFSGSGKITCGEASDQIVLVSGGTLKIQGGILQNLNGKHTVCVNSGKAEMAGGLVQGKLNNSDSGGGFYINNDGTLDISGGYIAGSTGSNGGGIYTKGTVNMTGGVIAANHANTGGGVYVDGTSNASEFNMTGGIVSGNSIYENVFGYGGGIYATGSNATLDFAGGYITNNSMLAYEANATHQGNGCHGGGGVAIYLGKFEMSGGNVTGNYSKEAGGGIYLGQYSATTITANFVMTGGTVASNVADNSEGGGIRVSGGVDGVISSSGLSKVYITNNKTNSDYDWGGGGIFVQEHGNLQILNSQIVNNEAGGFGGGVGACPTGQTIITHTDGAAIYNNIDHDGEHTSKGGHGKWADVDVAKTNETFMKNGHSDYFCVRYPGEARDYISLVTGQMIGGGAANWSGSCDGSYVEISKTGSAAAKYLFGLEANPDPEAISAAETTAGVIISGNYSYVHGGGIMTNGGLILGKKENIDIYPALRINATKELVLNGQEQNLENGQFTFQIYKGTDKPEWKEDGTLDTKNCTLVDTATNGSDGNISFDLGDYTGDGTFTYYMVEMSDSSSSFVYDRTIYKIAIGVQFDSENSSSLMGIEFNRYKINRVLVTTFDEKGTEIWVSTIENPASNTDGTVSIEIKKGNPTNNESTFTNEYKGYVLPETGGAGTKLYTIGGLLLIMGAGFILLYRSKKGERGCIILK